MNSGLLEIACFNEESALIAAHAGANRIELCANRQADGLTPDLDFINNLRQKIAIPIYVMIRPRAGNFSYSIAELQQIQHDIINIKTLGIDGFVFGILDDEGNVNAVQNRFLTQLASPLPCTFHKAFDVTADLFKALEDIIDCGFNNILSSGGKAGALEGAGVLKQLQWQAAGRIQIIAGGSIRSSNIEEIGRLTGIRHFHSSAIKGDGDIADEEEVRALIQKIK